MPSSVRYSVPVTVSPLAGAVIVQVGGAGTLSTRMLTVQALELPPSLMVTRKSTHSGGLPTPSATESQRNSWAVKGVARPLSGLASGEPAAAVALSQLDPPSRE
jgi:hypothetical protein